MNDSPQRQVKCPQCGRLSVFSSENPSRPFCSDRCKLIDLGEWAEGNYRVPTLPETPDELIHALEEVDPEESH